MNVPDNGRNRSNFEASESVFGHSKSIGLVATISNSALSSRGPRLKHARIGSEPSATLSGELVKSLDFSAQSHIIPSVTKSHERSVSNENQAKKWRLRLRVPAGLKRLISGAIAGGVSRTAVAPLETVRTHLMVGNGVGSFIDVFGQILKDDGWKGLFRGNGVNVLRVAPSKAIELFTYDTVSKALAPQPGRPCFPFPISPIAGATAGVCSTLITYPLELVKTRITVQRGVYKNLFHAMAKIYKEEGFRELYRGLCPSLIGVVPYAATNYFAYDSLRKLYRKFTKQQHIGNVPTLLIGSTAGALSSSATFPLEVARKQMQVGAYHGNVLFVMKKIVEKNGVAGLYRGLGASCIKLVPAAGISFMCYEACKYAFIQEDE